jgi:preprotein translocase subunit Sec63
MKRWSGKLLGVIAGALLLRGNPLFGALVGLIVGHAFDAGWLKGAAGRTGDDPYRVFGLTEEASDAEIELAYRRRISQVHPDRFDGAAPELRGQAEAKARELNGAYDRIRALRRKSGRRE